MLDEFREVPHGHARGLAILREELGEVLMDRLQGHADGASGAREVALGDWAVSITLAAGSGTHQG